LRERQAARRERGEKKRTLKGEETVVFKAGDPHTNTASEKTEHPPGEKKIIRLRGREETERRDSRKKEGKIPARCEKGLQPQAKNAVKKGTICPAKKPRLEEKESWFKTEKRPPERQKKQSKPDLETKECCPKQRGKYRNSGQRERLGSSERSLLGSGQKGRPKGNLTKQTDFNGKQAGQKLPWSENQRKTEEKRNIYQSKDTPSGR